MTTSAQINQLLSQLENAALHMADGKRQRITLRLDLNSVLTGGATCNVEGALETRTGLEVSLSPTSSRCVECGGEFPVCCASGDYHCPECQAR